MRPKSCFSYTTRLRKIKAFVILLVTFEHVIKLDCASADFEKIIDMQEDRNNLLTNV